MAGNILQKELSAVVLQNDNGASVASTVGILVSTQIDNRTGGNGAESWFANFELKAAFGSNPGAGLNLDLYLVPVLDGTNAADVDSLIPQPTYFVGSFLTVNSASLKRLDLTGVPLQALLYNVYLVNAGTGQTLSTNWGLRVVPVQTQYT